MTSQQSSFLGRFDIISSTAVIAAHANSPEAKFRQRDVKFLIELFGNWVEHSLGGAALSVQNTQVSRYLEKLVEDSLCTSSSKGRIPQYKLTRVGVVELLGRITTIPAQIQPELSFLACYFIYNYRQRLWDLVELEGKRFPLALRIELESLLDYSSLLNRLLAQAEIELRKLDGRISDAKAAAILANKLIRRECTVEEMAEAIEAEHPYELNSQKPLRELISGLSETHGQWELQHGTSRRSIDLWQPSRKILEAYLEALKGLAQANRNPHENPNRP